MTAPHDVVTEWLADRVHSARWPVDRLEGKSHLIPVWQCMRDAHEDSRRRGGDLADVLDLVGTHWIASFESLVHYRRVIDGLPAGELARMPAALFPFAHALADAKGPDDESYVRSIRAGPPRAPLWRKMGRLARYRFNDSGIRALPNRMIAMRRATVTLARTSLIERHAATRPSSEPVYYCNVESWFDGPVTAMPDRLDRDVSAFLDNLLSAYAGSSAVLNERDRRWLRSQFARSSAGLLSRLERLREIDNARLPHALWIGSSSDIWARMLAKVVKSRGRRVFSHDHGNGIGCFEPDLTPAKFARAITHFVCEKAEDASDTFARYAFDSTDLPEIVALPDLAHPNPAPPTVARYEMGRRHRPKVLYLPMTLGREYRNLLPYPDSPVTFDFDRRLVEWARSRNIDLYLKPHPEFGIQHFFPLAEASGAVVLTAPFEKVVDDMDVVVFPFATSTTFKYSLDIGKPMVLIDFGLADMSARFRRLVVERVNIVEGAVDDDNLLQCHLPALEASIARALGASALSAA